MAVEAAVAATVAAAFAAFAVAAVVVACLCKTAPFAVALLIIAMTLSRRHTVFDMEIFFNFGEQIKTFKHFFFAAAICCSPV